MVNFCGKAKTIPNKSENFFNLNHNNVKIAVTKGIIIETFILSNEPCGKIEFLLPSLYPVKLKV